jgi:predicted 3-demethylubiquinone-9 3-methyltransferase (glyoxalase superfamily)
VAFYLGIFPNSRILEIARYPKSEHPAHHGREGEVLTIGFELNGQSYTALNGGPFFQFTEAVSLQVMCDTQGEIDWYWEQLCKGGDEQARQCGWLKDRFGLSWQIVPARLIELLTTSDTATAARVMQAMLTMSKIEIAALEAAAAARP